MTCLLAALALCVQAQVPPAPPQPRPPPDTEIYLARRWRRSTAR